MVLNFVFFSRILREWPARRHQGEKNLVKPLILLVRHHTCFSDDNTYDYVDKKRQYRIQAYTDIV